MYKYRQFSVVELVYIANKNTNFFVQFAQKIFNVYVLDVEKNIMIAYVRTKYYIIYKEFWTKMLALMQKGENVYGTKDKCINH